MSNAYNSETNTGLQTAVRNSELVTAVASGMGVQVKKHDLKLETLGLNANDHGPEIRRLADQILNEAQNFNPNTYGVANGATSAQQSNQILDAIAVSETGGAEQKILDIINVTKSFSATTITAVKPGFFKRMLKPVNVAIENQRQKYHSVSERVGAIAEDLVNESNEIAKCNQILHGMKQQNQEEYHATALRIAAGTLALNDMIDQANAIDGEGRSLGYSYKTSQILHGLEKRLHDLQLTQTHRQQLAPQYEMLINNNDQLIDKYASVGTLLIPAWRNGITMALAIQRSERSAKVLNTLTDATQEYMLKNSQMLKESNVTVARLSQRSVIDVATLQKIQLDLEEGVRGVLEEQRAGAERRVNEMRQLDQLQANIENLARSEVKHLADRVAETQIPQDSIEQKVKQSSH